MKKVLVFGMTSNFGGVESVIMNYYRNINREKIQFDFLVYNELPYFHDEIKNLGGKIYIITGRRANFIRHKKELENFFKNHSKEYDGLWCNLCALSDISSLKKAYKYDIPIRIVHSHGAGHFTNQQTKILHMRNKKHIEKYATHFWACSHKAGEFFYNKKTLESKEYKKIYNAIDIEKFKYNERTRQIVRKKMELENKLVVGHIGYFSEVKNHEYLLHIFQELINVEPNARLLLVGDGYLRNDIEKKASELELINKISFLGTRTDVPELMQAMDVFVMPSVSEGLPVVLVEAQASGLSCVISDNITQEINITNNISYCSIKGDPQIWAYKILEMEQSNRKSVIPINMISKFDIKVQIREFENFFANRK